MITLQRLRMVHETAREGTVTAAAEALYVTQSAVSHGLGELERHLGVELFERRGRRMVPTPAGARLVEAARRVRAELDAARQEVAALREGQTGVLRVTTECYTSYHWLPAIMGAFRARHPRVELLIVPEHADAPLEAVAEGAADLAIVHTFRDRRGLERRSLGSDELVLVVSPEHPLACRSHVLPEDLAEETLLLHTGVEAADVSAQFFRPARVEPARVLELKLTEAVLSAVRAGLGVSVLARWAVRPELESGNVVAVSLTETGIERRWDVVYRAEDASSEPLMDLVELMACDAPTCEAHAA